MAQEEKRRPYDIPATSKQGDDDNTVKSNDKPSTTRQARQNRDQKVAG